jgi:hypothetical protein
VSQFEILIRVDVEWDRFFGNPCGQSILID